MTMARGSEVGMSWRQRPSNGRKRVRRGANGKTGVQIKGTAQKLEREKKKKKLKRKRVIW